MPVDFVDNVMIQDVIRTHKYGARKRELVWEITDELAAEIIAGPCYYCGKIPYPANGIDRFDNYMGYVIGNLVSCCGFCNWMKGRQNSQEFLIRVKRIYRKHLGLTWIKLSDEQ